MSDWGWWSKKFVWYSLSRFPWFWKGQQKNENCYKKVNFHNFVLYSFIKKQNKNNIEWISIWIIACIIYNNKHMLLRISIYPTRWCVIKGSFSRNRFISKQMIYGAWRLTKRSKIDFSSKWKSKKKGKDLRYINFVSRNW